MMCAVMCGHLELRFCQTSVYSRPCRSHPMTKQRWRLFISDQLRLQMWYAICAFLINTCALTRARQNSILELITDLVCSSVLLQTSPTASIQRQSTRESLTLSKLRQSSSVICPIHSRSCALIEIEKIANQELVRNTVRARVARVRRVRR